MSDAAETGSRSFYFFDIDDNLVFLDTKLYLWNAETGQEKPISSGEFTAVEPLLGHPGPWQAWSVRDKTYRDFRDKPNTPLREQIFVTDLNAAVKGGGNWKGPSWPLLEHAACNQRTIAIITARGHDPSTIEEGLKVLVELGQIPALPPIIDIYAVNNPAVRAKIGITDPLMTTPSAKKLAIRHAVDTALKDYGPDPAHRFGMSDDDPANVALAISAMRDCKLAYPEKRFFVIKTNKADLVKLEIFRYDDPVTATLAGKRVL